MSYGTGKDTKYIITVVMMEDIATPPQEWLGTPTSTLDTHATGFPLDPRHL